jgi:hypothetical protein
MLPPRNSYLRKWTSKGAEITLAAVPLSLSFPPEPGHSSDTAPPTRPKQNRTRMHLLKRVNTASIRACQALNRSGIRGTLCWCRSSAYSLPRFLSCANLTLLMCTLVCHPGCRGHFPGPRDSSMASATSEPVPLQTDGRSLERRWAMLRSKCQRGRKHQESRSGSATAKTANGQASQGKKSTSPKIKNDASGDSQALFSKGAAALQGGDLDGAEKAFRQVAAIDPITGGAYANLGVVAMRRKDWGHALSLLERAARLAPKVSGIRLNYWPRTLAPRRLCSGNSSVLFRPARPA